MELSAEQANADIRARAENIEKEGESYATEVAKSRSTLDSMKEEMEEEKRRVGVMLSQHQTIKAEKKEERMIPEEERRRLQASLDEALKGRRTTKSVVADYQVVRARLEKK